MIRNRCFTGIAASALLAGATLLSLGLATPGHAAEGDRDAASGLATGKRQHSPRDAASGLPTGKRQHKPLLDACVAKQDEVDALVAQIQQQMSELQARCQELEALTAEADQAMSSSSEEDAALLAQIEEAQRVFEEQVAFLLDSSVSSSVSSSLESSRAALSGEGSPTEEVSFSEGISPLLDELSSLSSSFSSFVEACATSSKHTKTGHVTLLK